jgi:hypothetical protein
MWKIRLVMKMIDMERKGHNSSRYSSTSPVRSTVPRKGAGTSRDVTSFYTSRNDADSDFCSLRFNDSDRAR